MDRFEWTNRDCRREHALRSQAGVRLYDNEHKRDFEDGEATVTSHRLLWRRTGENEPTIGLSLHYVVFAEEHASLLKASKIIVYLSGASPKRSPGPVQHSSSNYIKLSFQLGGASKFLIAMREALTERKWEQTPLLLIKGKNLRSGITGIENEINLKTKIIEKDISKSFQDLSNLISMAGSIVTLTRNISAKIKERQGNSTENETIQFKSYLLSLGIDDPVTRETVGSETQYFLEIAKEIAISMEEPIKEAGGLLPLADIYCRVNRARGLVKLLSPEDLFHACLQMDRLGLPVVLKTFSSGVMVLQLRTHDEDNTARSTAKLLEENECLSAGELSCLIGVPIVLALERLMDAEKMGLACRDDSLSGLRYYPNLFLTRQD